MKIYSNILNLADVYVAATEARQYDKQVISVYDTREFKPRSRYVNGVECFAEGNSPHRAAHVNSYGEYPMAATWTAYGYLIARLFDRDPAAKIGQYDSVQDFISQCLRQWPNRSTYKRESIDFLELVGGI